MYWKPIQSGLTDPTDRQTVQKLTQLGMEHFAPSAYELWAPLSPHEAARREGVEIDLTRITLPDTHKPLIVEGAGGLMVPLTKTELIIDLIAQLNLPVILVCRSALGTINHTLLSLEALRRRDISPAGLIISGKKAPHNRQALEEYGHVPVIAEIDYLDPLDRTALLAIPPEIPLT